MRKVKALIWMVSILSMRAVMAQQPAFPGAEGAGMYTSGGRGTAATPTTVFEVTNLSDVNTAGSLRYACSQSITTFPYRTIVFRLSGTIHLTSRLTIPRNTTLAGQTAPGDGVCVADFPAVISGDNVIVRYMRFRMGDKNQLKTSPAGCGLPVAPFSASCVPIDGSGGDDAFGNLGNKNLIIDHCSVSWSDDEALTVYRGDSVTMQWNFIEEPLNYSYHFETGDSDFEHHGYGGIWGSRHGSFHHNLFAHCNSRNPRLAGNSTYNGDIESADLRNNVIFDWSLYTVYGGEGGQYNLVNNYYKFGPSTGSNTKFRIVNVDSSAADGYAKYFLSGNYVDGSPANTANNWSGAFMLSGRAADTVRSKQDQPFLSSYPQITTEPAVDAYENVLNNAGATLPRRDTLDRRIVNDVRYRTGRLIDVQGGFAHGTAYDQTVNAWPALNSTAAPADSDHDGMPDSWETSNGLDPADAADRQLFAANGYTNLENYLNSITNASPEIYFSGVINAFSQPATTRSAAQTISISGQNLIGDITIEMPAGYQISLDGGATWSSGPVNLAAANGVVNSTSIAISLNGDTVGQYIGYLVAKTPGAGYFYFALNGRKNAPASNGPASATWTLLTNADAAVTGGITAGSQSLGSAISGTQYGSSFGGIGGWQRAATTVFLPINYDANSYVEYTVAAPAGKYFTDTLITLSALGGATGTARMAIYYSKDGFATSNAIAPITYNGIVYQNGTNNTNSVSLLNTSTPALAGQQIASSGNHIVIAPGETLTIRIYLWITGTGNRYFASQNVTLSGYVSDGEVLPVKLTAFSASADAGHAHINWQTAGESGLSRFQVESSADGAQYATTGSVAARNSIAGSGYEFQDPSLLTAARYYRLKIIEHDGGFTYSHAVIVYPANAAKLSVFPNPANSNVTVTFRPLQNSSILRLFSGDGRLLETIKIAKGSSQAELNITRLDKGRYVIKLEETAQTISFLKQ